MERKVTTAVSLLVFAIVATGLVGCGGGEGSGDRPAGTPTPAADAVPSSPMGTPAPAPLSPEPRPENPPPPAPRVEPPRPPVSKAPPAERPEKTAPAAPAMPAEVAPPPPAEPIVKTLAAGTTLDLEFLDGVSSKTSQPGNTFRARVVRDVEVDGVAVVPAGSIVTGRVREATATKKIGGKAKLTLEFAELQPRNGRAAAIQASWSQEGKSETAKDAATIGGATAGGALLGRLLGKDGDKNKATAIGAVVGAAAGTAVAAKTAGQEVEVPAGSTLAIVLDAPVQMTVLP